MSAPLSSPSRALLSGVGLGWRPETAWLAHSRSSLGFVEVVAESICAGRPTPPPLRGLVDRGMPVVVHGVSLSLGGSEPPDPARLDRLADLAQELQSPFVSEHLAFVRGGGREAGHLLPIPRTREMIDIVVENVRLTQAALPVPLVLENIATLFEWPGAELDEGPFLAEILCRTGAKILLDVSNLYANGHNHAFDPMRVIEALRPGDIAYVHVAGGTVVDEIVHDTHAHPVLPGSLHLLERLLARVGPMPVLLEHDASFGTRAALEAELETLEAILLRHRIAGARRVA